MVSSDNQGADASFAAARRSTIDAAALDQLFFKARSHNAWTDAPVTEAQIRQMYDIACLGPTSVNSNPMRCIWVRSSEEKARLAEMAFDNNKPKVLSAPVIAIIGFDVDFAAEADRLFPHKPEAIRMFAAKMAGWAEETAFRNGSLQAAYLMLAARAIGLDCGPMSGFDNAAVDAAYFAGTSIRSNFLCAFGHGSTQALFERLPRLSFEDANSFA